MRRPFLFKFRHNTLPKILWYITGRFIYDKILNILWHRAGKLPMWGDAKWCGKKYCRVCGGKKYKDLR